MLIALGRATYVAKSSKNSIPLFLLIVKRGEEISIDRKRNGINSRYVLELQLHENDRNSLSNRQEEQIGL